MTFDGTPRGCHSDIMSVNTSQESWEAVLFSAQPIQGVQKILLMHVHFRMQCELFRTRKRLTANLDIRT